MASGVKVAVQVMPPSVLLRLLRTPLIADKSVSVKPVTASLKVMVTVAVSPTVRSLSLRLMVAVGRWVSMA
ncbi:hypothetical protein D3C81_1428080 [compost metagenome]